MNERTPVLAEIGAERRRGPGGRLQAARLERGLEVAAVAAALRISPYIVTAIEEDRYDAFDAPVYARGFLRTYAGFLGLPVNELLAAYDQTAGSQPLPSLIPPASAEPRRRDYSLLQVAALLVLALLLVGASYWWWLARSPGAEPALSVATDQPAAVPAGAEAVADGTAPEVGNDLPPQPSESATMAGMPEQVAPSAQPVATPAPAPPATHAPVNALAVQAGTTPAALPATTQKRAATPATPATATAAPAGATLTALPVPSRAAAGGPPVVLRSSKDCWVEVRSATGARLFYDLVRAGQTRTVSGPAPWRVFLGNAAGIEVSVAGRVAEVPASRRDGTRARFGLSADGAVH